jgi:hypothetical protein
MVGENSVEESMFSSYRSTCIWDKPFIERLLASFEPPKAESGSDEYVYDPMKPLIPYPSELLIFNFAVLVSSHLTRRGERDCTTIGAFYNVAS